MFRISSPCLEEAFDDAQVAEEMGEVVQAIGKQEGVGELTQTLSVGQALGRGNQWGKRHCNIGNGRDSRDRGGI